jgi:DNA-directed RNA polymerase subunit F
MYEQRNFAIFSTTEIDKIDFNLVLETSADTLRKSVDETKTFVKWDGGEAPEFVSELTTLEGPYTYAEILDILSTSEWTAPMEEM